MRNAEPWAPREATPIFDPGRHPEYTLRLLRTGWQRLGADERSSVVAAAQVSADLARLGAPASILGAASRVVEDEVRHVEVCGRVLERLGVEPLDTVPGARAPAATTSTSLETTCARDLLAGFAVSEPMSAACFAACRRGTKEALFRWALTELLRDEARHGAFGIRAGAWVIRNWDAARRAELWPSCVAEMQGFERAIGGPIPEDAAEPPTDPSLSDVGLLPPYVTCGAAIACLPRWVLRPLAELGIAPTQ